MKLVSIYAAAGLLEAEMLKAFLEAQGLTVFLSQESVGRTLGLSAGTLGMVEVMVPEERVSEAKALLTAISDGEFNDVEYHEENDLPEDQDPD